MTEYTYTITDNGVPYSLVGQSNFPKGQFDRIEDNNGLAIENIKYHWLDNNDYALTCSNAEGILETRKVDLYDNLVAERVRSMLAGITLLAPSSTVAERVRSMLAGITLLAPSSTIEERYLSADKDRFPEGGIQGVSETNHLQIFCDASDVQKKWKEGDLLTPPETPDVSDSLNRDR